MATQTVFPVDEERKVQHRKVFHKDHKWDSGGTRMPQTKRERSLFLMGDKRFRQPITRSERRQWTKMWRLKGKGVTR